MIWEVITGNTYPSRLLGFSIGPKSLPLSSFTLFSFLNSDYIVVLFDVCQKSCHFLRRGLGIMVNGQELRNLFLVFELSQPII